MYKRGTKRLIIRSLIVIFMILGLFGLNNSEAQQTIHYWSFNDGTNSELDAGNNEPTTIPADIGDATIHHELNFSSYIGSSINAEEDFSAGEAFSPNASGNIGESFEFHVDTEGYKDVIFSFAAQRTSTGYDNNTIEVSSDNGQSWTTVATGLELPDSFELLSYDLTQVDQNVRDNTEVRIRLTLDTSEASGGGNNRYDNVKIEGTPEHQIFSESGGGPPPNGWTFGNEADDINRDDYWLLQTEGKPNEDYFIETKEYDLSQYDAAEFNVKVAAFGSGTYHPALIELSTDGGETFEQVKESEAPIDNSDYIDGGPVVFKEVSDKVVLRLTNTGESGRGIRLRDLEFFGIEYETITTNISGNAGWRMLSFPLEDVQISDLAAQDQIQGVSGATDFYQGEGYSFDGIEEMDTDDPNFYFYYDDNWSTPDNFDETNDPGTGTIWYFYDNPENAQQQELPSNELPVSLELSGLIPDDTVTVQGLDEDEWNLIGNPFASPIDPGELVFRDSGGDEVENVVADGSIWNPSGDTYETVDFDTDEIAAWQGFFVHTGDSPGVTSVDIPVAAQSEGDPTFYREQSMDRARISFTLEGKNKEQGLSTTDRAISMLFHGDGQSGWDYRDMPKLTPLVSQDDHFATLSFVGSRDGNTVYKSQESRPLNPESEFELDMNLQKYQMSGDFTLEWGEPESLPVDLEITLIDHETGTENRLKETSSYSFEAGGEESSGRIVGVDDQSLLPQARAVAQEDTGNDYRFSLKISPEDVTSAEAGSELPEELTLNQNYPNPFNPATTISYALPEEGQVQLEVYDVMGRRITTLVDEQRPAGEHEAAWDASEVSSGTYMYRLEIDGQVQTRTMTLVK